MSISVEATVWDVIITRFDAIGAEEFESQVTSAAEALSQWSKPPVILRVTLDGVELLVIYADGLIDAHDDWPTYAPWVFHDSLSKCFVIAEAAS